MKIFKSASVSILLLLASVTSAAAYSYRTCEGVPLRFAGNSLTLNYNTTSFSGDYRTAILNSIAQFNDHPSNFFFTSSASTTQNLENGRSEVWGSTDNNILKGAPAVTISTWDCFWLFGWVRKMKESDVIFDYRNNNNANWLWTTSETKSANRWYAGTKRLLNTTAIHEFGHAAGLGHEARFYNVMGSDFTHVNTEGSAVRGYVGADAGGGLRFLYGQWSSASQNLGVAHWYRTGQDGEYSVHSRTRILATSGSPLSSFTAGGEPVYRVNRGQQVDVEFTFENLGKSQQTQRPINFYISTDESISTTDRLISTGYWITVSPSGHFTARWRVTMPSTNLTSGTNFWLGVIVNPNGNAPSESRYADNTSYIRIRIN